MAAAARRLALATSTRTATDVRCRRPVASGAGSRAHVGQRSAYPSGSFLTDGVAGAGAWDGIHERLREGYPLNLRTTP
jgi:hypothetical protein